MTPLTQAQEHLWSYLKSCDRCPSFDEMKDAMGLASKSGVHRLVNGLEAKGYVSRINRGGYRMARALIVHDEPKPIRSPLSLYTLNELLDEVGSRLPTRFAA